MAGLTATGFVPRSVDELRAIMEERLRTRLGADVDVSAESLLGNVIAVCATMFGELWEGAEAVYVARDPRAATGAALDVCAALSPGIERLAASKGTVTLRLNVAAGTTIAAGAVARVDGEPTNRWVTTEDAVNSTGSPANVDVAAEAELAGRVLAGTGTITVIATPAVGWNSVTNPADAEPGSEVETNPALRVRREQRLQRAGSSPLNAVAAQVSEVEGVTHCLCWENTSAYVDADGRPPHTVEAMVIGGDAEDIARAIFAAKASGIGTHGTETPVTFTDDNGQSRTVKFSRPTSVNAYVTARVRFDPDTYAGDDAVEAALLDAGAPYVTGEDPRISDFVVAVRDVTGVTDVTILLGATSLAQVNANLSVGPRERAVFADARVTVEQV